jgi:hypothetical protein
MKTLSTLLFPLLNSHSKIHPKKLDVYNSEEKAIGTYHEIAQLIKEDILLDPSETSIKIIMDYARQKLN